MRNEEQLHENTEAAEGMPRDFKNSPLDPGNSEGTDRKPFKKGKSRSSIDT